MQLTFPFYDTRFSLPTQTERKPKKELGGWNENDIIPYKHPGSDSFDNETFAWEMTVGKDGIIYTPVRVINPPDDEWREYPRRKRKL